MLGFAKLKGFSPWPARKLGQAEAGGKVWVRFFGENQLGTVPRKNWTELTPESHKTVGIKNAKNNKYATALELMIEASDENCTLANGNSNNPGVVLAQDVVELDEIPLNTQAQKAHVKKPAKPQNKNQEKTKSALAKKTLQDSEREVSNNFSNKIVTEDSGFYCKNCKFSSALKLRAKTHAMTCGKKIKKFSSRKKSPCPECASVFSSRKELNQHYKVKHQTSSYKCSKCLKSYKLRKTYLAHLRTHDDSYLERFQCDLCDYKGVDMWNLKRHTARKHSDIHLVPLNVNVVTEPGIPGIKHSIVRQLTNETDQDKPDTDIEVTTNEIVMAPDTDVEVTSNQIVIAPYSDV
jgi:DNA-directed RNA polymerase subunit RPC12/RpoP